MGHEFYKLLQLKQTIKENFSQSTMKENENLLTMAWKPNFEHEYIYFLSSV